MTPTLTTIELYEERFGFSAAHFTIFSATSRERLHGHNYQVKACFTTEVHDNGISFDYAIYKTKLYELCQQLNSYLLLPSASPHLNIVEKSAYFQVHFHDEEMSFLKKDVLVLPIRNITMEELASWFLKQLVGDQVTLTACHVHDLIIKVSNGPGRWGSARLTSSPLPHACGGRGLGRGGI